MIIVHIFKGLGNQLTQYATGRALALRRGTELRLDVSSYESAPSRRFGLGHFNVQAAVATAADVARVRRTGNSFVARAYRAVDLLKPYYKRRFVRDPLWRFDPNMFKVSRNAYLYGYWGHERYFSDYRSVLLDECDVKEEFVTPARDLIDEVSDASSVSVHIRRGDYVTDEYAASLFGALPLNYYQRAMARMVASVPDACFYVFSDDIAWARDALGGRYPTVYVDRFSTDEDYLDLKVMSCCKHNIIANSTFSWWGAWLNRNPAKIVMAPYEWYRPEKIDNDDVVITPPSWIRL